MPCQATGSTSGGGTSTTAELAGYEDEPLAGDCARTGGADAFLAVEIERPRSGPIRDMDHHEGDQGCQERPRTAFTATPPPGLNRPPSSPNTGPEAKPPSANRAPFTPA